MSTTGTGTDPEPEPRVYGPLLEGKSSTNASPARSRSSSTSSDGVPDTEDKELAKHTFTLTFEDKDYEQGVTVRTDSVAVDGTLMYLMVYPGGNKDETQMSAFIFFEKSATGRPYGWEAFFKFQFACLNVDPTKNVKNSTQMRCTEHSASWGFPSLIAIKRARNPDEGFLHDGKLTIEATVTATSGESVATWGIHSRYSSKKATGCVGLNNQGATCYMNSVLQTLFHTHALRRAVFQMPITQDDTKSTVALALQRLFYHLQTESDAVPTKELTKSFGWTGAEAFMQHDVQEFLRVLMDNIEEKMKETPVAGFVPNLFAGTTQSYIRCTEVAFESTREETFYDVQLNVRGVASIQEALKQYITPEILDGDNKYHAEGHGLQVAKHGTIFKRLPPVLHLQLKRFEFSLTYEDYVKINDRFEFTETLDMSPFVSEPSPDGEEYVLHSVLVHSGGSHGGHYFVYIRPNPEGHWLKFNDDVVTKASAKQAIDANFGGSSTRDFRDYGTNAYMLVYIRKSRLADDQRPLDADDVPQTLLQRFEEDKEAAEKAQREAIELTKSIHVDVITEEYFKQRAEPELFDVGLPQKAAGVVSLLIRRDAPIQTLMEEIDKVSGVAVDHQRLYSLARRNGRLAIRDLLAPGTLVRDACSYVRSPRWRVYLECADPTVAREETDRLVFVRHFDPATKKLHYHGHFVLGIDENLSRLLALGQSGSTIYVDSNSEPKEVDPSDIDLPNGTTVVLQPPLVEGQQSFSDFVDDLLNQVSMTFKRKMPDGEPTPEPLTLSLDQRLTYSEVAQAIGRAIGVDTSDHIQFYEHYMNYDEPGVAVLWGEDVTLEKMRTRGTWACSTLFFEVLPLPVVVVQADKVRLTCSVFDHESHAFKPLDLFLDKLKTLEESFADIVPHLPRQPTRPLRLFYMSSMYLVTMPKLTDVLDQFVMRYRRYYLEEIPEDQEGLDLEVEKDGRRLGVILHIAREIYRTHGHPSVFPFIEGEIVSALRQRLADYFGVTVASIAKWRIGYELNRSIRYLDDEAVISLETLRVDKTLTLYLDHPDQNAKRSRYYTEKAVKIYN